MTAASVARRRSKAVNATFDFDQHIDWVLVLLITILLAAGLIMLTSASISLAERNTGNPLFYFQQQLYAVVAGLIGAALMLRIPTSIWERSSLLLVIGAIALLVAVLIPGLGLTVNGSTRWLSIGEST